MVLDPFNGSIYTQKDGTIYGVLPMLSTTPTGAHKTITVPDAGRIYYGIGRNAAYAAAARGDIPTIKVGRLLRVPVAAMERRLEQAV
jgi:hypothetical protein